MYGKTPNWYSNNTSGEIVETRISALIDSFPKYTVLLFTFTLSNDRIFISPYPEYSFVTGLYFLLTL